MGKPYIGGVILTCSRSIGDKMTLNLDFNVEKAGLGKTGFVTTSFIVLLNFFQKTSSNRNDFSLKSMKF